MFLPILLPRDLWFASSSWVSQLMLLWSCLWNYPLNTLLLFSSDVLKSWTAVLQGSFILQLLRKHHTASCGGYIP